MFLRMRDLTSRTKVVYSATFLGTSQPQPRRPHWFSRKIRQTTQFHARMCLLGVLPLIHSQDARTDFHAKYVKRRGFAQGCAFWGFRNHSLTFKPLFPPKTPLMGPVSTGQIFARKWPNGKAAGRERPLIVIVAP